MPVLRRVASRRVSSRLCSEMEIESQRKRDRMTEKKRREERNERKTRGGRLYFDPREAICETLPEIRGSRKPLPRKPSPVSTLDSDNNPDPGLLSSRIQLPREMLPSCPCQETTLIFAPRFPRNTVAMRRNDESGALTRGANKLYESFRDANSFLETLANEQENIRKRIRKKDSKVSLKITFKKSH